MMGIEEMQRAFDPDTWGFPYIESAVLNRRLTQR
jgi:hypothetical protein